MPSYINKHYFTGHLGADARFVELPAKEGQTRNFVANFRVAATKRYSTRSGDRRERTTWFTVKLTLSANGLSFFTDKLKKGAYVFVDGEPLVDEKSADQGKQYFHYVRADLVEILAEAKSAPAPEKHDDDDEDVPVTRNSQMHEAPVEPPRPKPPAPPPPPTVRPAQSNVQPHRVHELPPDAHSRFDTANF